MRDLKRKDKLVEAAGDVYWKTLSLAVLDVCNDESVKQCINGIKDRHVDVLSKSEKDIFIKLCLGLLKHVKCIVDHTPILYFHSSHPNQSTMQESAWWVRWRASPLKR